MIALEEKVFFFMRNRVYGRRMNSNEIAKEQSTPQKSDRSAYIWLIAHYVLFAITLGCLALPAFTILNVASTTPEAGIAIVIASFLPALLILPITSLLAVIFGVIAIRRMDKSVGRIIVITTTILAGLTLAPIPLLLL